eukprot:6272476-Prymnesium_polylepis.1
MGNYKAACKRRRRRRARTWRVVLARSVGCDSPAQIELRALGYGSPAQSVRVLRTRRPAPSPRRHSAPLAAAEPPSRAAQPGPLVRAAHLSRPS